MRGCPPFLSLLPSLYPVLLYGVGGVLGGFRVLLKVFKLFSKNFWEANPALTRGFSALFKSD